jgi:hypothetical protein
MPVHASTLFVGVQGFRMVPKSGGLDRCIVPIQIATPSANIDKLRDKVIDVYGLRYDLVLSLDI